MRISRRDLGRMAMAALPAGLLRAAPKSNWGGVQIGVILSATALPGIPVPADAVLKNVVDLGIGAMELQAVRVETYAGAPASARELNAWRLAAPLDKYKQLRQMYQDAGVNIYAFRITSFTSETPDALLHYYFDAAQALGATHITLELPKDPQLSERLGAYAATRGTIVGYHNHTQVNFNSWDTALSQSKANGINFDVGHFAAAVSQSPIPFLEKHHDRITCLHLKDRKFGAGGGQNVPWGEGDTPLKEILLLMQRKKYPFPAAIELEYKIPGNSSTMAELTRCVRYCKDVLAY